MKRFDASRWAVVSPLLDELLEVDDRCRAQRLAEIRADDPQSADDLEALLAQRTAVERESFLAGAAVELVGEASANEVVGNYTLERAIGQGGMGTVWLARRSDGRFEGEVAVKLLKGGMFDAAAQERFRREGAILARLRHPGIAHLLDAGITVSAQPFLVLELVRGERIDRWCEARALSVRQRIELFLQVLDAVAAAHGQLVIHRDLKPTNVLVDQAGRVKLLDFGIARLLPGQDSAEQTALTREGSFALTPEYAAPEQFQGGVLSMATDVYALGTVLYELLTGTHPSGLAPRSAPLAYMKAALEGNAAPASTRAPQHRGELRGDVDNILAKCLAPGASARYASVSALRDDLQRHLRDEPVSALPPTLRYQARKFVRRRPVETVLATVAALFLIVGAAGTAMFARQAQHSAAEALAARDRAALEAQHALAQRDLARAQANRARAFNDLNDFILSQSSPGDRPVTLRGLLEKSLELVEHQANLELPNKIEMLTAIGTRYSSLEDNARAREVLEHAVELAVRQGDLGLEAGARCALAAELGLAGQMPQAESIAFQQAERLKSKPEYANQRVECLRLSSFAARILGMGAVAVARVEEAARLLSALDVPSPVLSLRVAVDLAGSYAAVGQGARAATAYEDAFRQMQDLGREQTLDGRTLHNQLAVLLTQMGRWRQALEQTSRAMALEKSLQVDDSRSIDTLVNHARALALVAQTREAARFIDKAVDVARRRSRDLSFSSALLVQSSVRRQLGHFDAAAQALDEAQHIVSERLPAGHWAYGAMLIERARLFFARGDAAGALLLASKAIDGAETQAGATRALPGWLVCRAEIALAAKQFDVAANDAVRALDLLGKQQGEQIESAWAGRAHGVLAYLRLHESRKADASVEFAHALQNMVPTLGSEHPDVVKLRRQAGSLAAL
jgi:tetratricopeptide (TPR) repeat protein